MRLTDEAIQRLNLESVENDLISCWAYKITNTDIFISNHTTIDYEPFEDNMCWIFEVKKVQPSWMIYPVKYCKYFHATIDFVNDTCTIEEIQGLLNYIPWPENKSL